MRTTLASSRNRMSAVGCCRLACLGGLALVFGGAGCLGDLDSSFTEEAPVLLAASQDAISVGGMLEFYGANFAHSKENHTELRFDGKFTTSSGEAQKVSYKLTPHWMDGNRLVWAQVGPFSNPFSSADQMGTFEGKVRAINVLGTGIASESEPLPMTIKFQESIVVRTLAPLNSDCGEPVTRLLGGFPYRLEVEAVGFDPINFTYSISGDSEKAKGARPRIFRQAAKGRVDSLGDTGELVFAAVPQDVSFYLVELTISSLGSDGKERSTSLVFGVHRPIEYVDSGKFAIAEVFSPTHESGCIAGGSTPRQVSYMQLTEDRRERNVQTNWNEAWSDQDSSTKSLSTAVTKGIRIETNGSSTVSSTAGWSYGGGVSGGINILNAIKVGVSAEFSRSGSTTTSYTNGWSVGRDYSTTDTESWAFEQTRGYTLSKGGSDFWSVSSSDQKSLTMNAEILPGQFGVFYRQTVRYSLPGAWMAYNVCGQPTRVGEGNFFDYNWSLDLGTGSECPPFPKSALPEAQCYIKPCSNE